MKNIYLTIAALFAAATVNVQAQNIANGHEYVDLGLPSGTLWATCNVGATNPEDYGDYFAWGETETKNNYTWATYKWSAATDKLTKYCNDSLLGYTNHPLVPGFTDDKLVLDPEDDAAHVIWGGGWRMPTIEEMAELAHNCKYTSTWQNGVGGMRFTSEATGNSIFLPDAGYYKGTDRLTFGTQGYYWSSSLAKSDARDAKYMFIGNHPTTYEILPRYFGYSVRPVISNTATGIKSINNYQLSINGAAGAVRYNLAGQRVGDDYKGIVIVNGKKRIVK